MAVTHSNRNGTSLAVAATTGVVAFLLTVVVGVEAVPTLCYHINTNTHPAFRIRARQQQQQHDPLQRVSRTYSPLQLQLPPHPFEPKGRLSSSARFSSKDDNGDDAANDGDDDEWFPHDPAWTTPQLLEGIWSQIAQAQDLVHGESSTVIYPQMQDEFVKPRYLNLLFAHLDSCKDVCDHFGITTTLIPYTPKGSKSVAGFTVKSFRKNNPSSAKSGNADGAAEPRGEYDFAYDPHWDDGTDFEALYDGIDDEHMVPDKYPSIVNKVPDSDEVIIDVTKQWVNAMMSDMGVCPFTQGAEKAGLPVGQVFYTVDRTVGFEDMYTRYWKEVSRLEQNNEKDLSTTLLIAPEFCLENLELFESFTNTLTQPLAALGVEDLIQLVFFHPVWSFRDGSARSSLDGSAANYARRSPWPMINILRTSQVRAAQKGIPTGLVYKQNEKTLANIGVDKLETMLRLRDWTDTSEYKVNRKEVDALKIAQDYQSLGKVADEDMSLQHDATPAANKVDRRQVEEGDLVNVLLQALEKRLGKAAAAASSGATYELSGPETSATAMATDVLIGELDALTEKKDTNDSSAMVSESAPSFNAMPSPVPQKEKWQPRQEQQQQPLDPRFNAFTKSSAAAPPDEIARARQARIDAARMSMLEDVTSTADDSNRPANPGRSDPIQDVLFGRGGITNRNVEEEMFPEGMNPDNFY